MDVLLIPGLWLTASSWDEVVPGLRTAGLEPVALTMPGVRRGETPPDPAMAEIGIGEGSTPSSPRSTGVRSP